MAYDIIVAGLLTLDMFPDVTMLAPENFTDAGKLFEIGNMSIATGGAVSNTGLALHRLGTSVGLMSVIGNDWIGSLILDSLLSHEDSFGDYVSRTTLSSAYTLVIESKNQDRTFLTHTGSNHLFGIHSLDFKAINQAKIFHLGYPTLLPRLYENDGDELVKIFTAVKERSTCITSLDMTVPDPNNASGQANWQTILQRTLPHVDIFIPSIEEILYMLRRADYENWKSDVLPHLSTDYLQTLADEMIAMGCGMVGFKLGTRGLFLKTTDDVSRLSFLENINQSPDTWCHQQVWQPAFKVDVAGTTGAGDAAYAGFLSALLRGFDIEMCAEMGCAVGACNVEAADATSGVRNWDDTRARLGAGWETYQ